MYFIITQCPEDLTRGRARAIAASRKQAIRCADIMRADYAARGHSNDIIVRVVSDTQKRIRLFV